MLIATLRAISAKREVVGIDSTSSICDCVSTRAAMGENHIGEKEKFGCEDDQQAEDDGEGKSLHQ